MNQIAPLSVWIGHGGEGRDFREVFDAGIEAIVQVAAGAVRQGKMAADPPPANTKVHVERISIRSSGRHERRQDERIEIRST